MLAAEGKPLDVDRHGPVPDRIAGGEDRLIGFIEDPGVVVEDVEPAEAVRCGLNEAGDIRLLRDITGDGHRLSISPADRLIDRLTVDVGGDDACAFPHEALSGRAAHAASGTRDERHLTLEPSQCSSLESRGSGPPADPPSGCPLFDARLRAKSRSRSP